MKKLSVMIVDDARVIVDGFQELVNWGRIGCEVVATAFDDIMAVNEMLRLKPNIVVIDINMPLLTGLEVIKRVNAELMDTVFIIISGYDNFAYLREALKLRVFDYLLKPVDFILFEALIERIRQERFELMPEWAGEDKDIPASDTLPTINRIVAFINEHLSEDLRLKALAAEFSGNLSDPHRGLLRLCPAVFNRGYDRGRCKRIGIPQQKERLPHAGTFTAQYVRKAHPCQRPGVGGCLFCRILAAVDDDHRPLHGKRAPVHALLLGQHPKLRG